MTFLEMCLNRIKYDEDEDGIEPLGDSFFCRSTSPSRPRHWPLYGSTKRRVNPGYIRAWDLKNADGQSAGFSYITGAKIGRNRSFLEKSTVTTYDPELPEDTCGRVITIVDVISIDDLSAREAEVIEDALRRLFPTVLK